MLFDNAVDHGQPQARAPTRLLGGEKGFEDGFQHLPIHAHTGIAYGQFHIAPGRHFRVPTDVCITKHHVGQGHGQDTTFRHGVLRIDNQVHKHLFDLAHVGTDGPQ